MFSRAQEEWTYYYASKQEMLFSHNNFEKEYLYMSCKIFLDLFTCSVEPFKAGHKDNLKLWTNLDDLFMANCFIMTYFLEGQFLALIFINLLASEL
jgi:hypothetical protein